MITELRPYAAQFSLGVVACSSPTVGQCRLKVERALRTLREAGFSLRVGRTVFRGGEGYLSASIQERKEDLEDMFRDPNVNVILNTTGGYNSNEILEFLDYEVIRKNPKWFVGYSDLTALNLALYVKAGIRTVNGTMLVDFVENPRCFLELFETLAANGRVDFNVSGRFWESGCGEEEAPQIACLVGKCPRSNGILVAANLSTFNLLLGTGYLPDLYRSILFLEYDREERNALPSLERYLWQMRQAGVFENIVGMVFGLLERSVRSEEDQKRNLQRILDGVTEGYDFPVIYNAPFGHTYPSWNLLIGSFVEIEGCRITSLGFPHAA